MQKAILITTMCICLTFISFAQNNIYEIFSDFDIAEKELVTLESGLQYIKIIEGSGKKVETGSKVEVNYTGFFADGKVFDSSVVNGSVFKFKVGKGKVIAGWDEGVQYMKQGDSFFFIIPWQLAYGENGYNNIIPPRTNLYFVIEVLEVK